MLLAVCFYHAVMTAFDDSLLFGRKRFAPSKVLHPIVIVTGYANFLKFGVHQVFTVSFALKPAGHNLRNALLSHRNVFAHGKTFPSLKIVPCKNYTVLHASAVLARMAKVISLRHIARVAYGRYLQLIVPNQWRCGGHKGMTTVTAISAGAINPF